MNTLLTWISVRLRKSLRDAAYASLIIGAFLLGTEEFTPDRLLFTPPGIDPSTMRLIVEGGGFRMAASAVIHIAFWSAFIRIAVAPWLVPAVIWVITKLETASQALPQRLKVGVRLGRHALIPAWVIGLLTVGLTAQGPVSAWGLNTFWIAIALTVVLYATNALIIAGEANATDVADAALGQEMTP